MKAIKLASIFAVTAVAAAVSTTTIAAEPVFSGDAGLSYNAEDGGESWSSEGEVNIIIDTGVIYVDLDMGTVITKAEVDEDDESLVTESADGFVLDEVYITQGAVQFGDFDGSISADAQFTAGVWEEGEFGVGDNPDLGIRYAAAPGLTVALEMVEGKDGVGFAASYEADLSGLTLGVSAGSYTSEDDAVDATTTSVGVSTDLGIATVLASLSTGEDSGADFSSYVLGADIALSDALSVSAQFSAETELEEDNVEVTAYYTAGDITYFATSLTGDSEATTLGAYASF